MALIRLDRIISETGTATRKEAKLLIKSGRVSVDGITALSPDDKADPGLSLICVDGKPIDHKTFRCIMMNKPAGVLSATEDPSQQTVLDLLPEPLRRQGLFPVGRLDKDTTGLLLLTNDGDFSHAVISPKRHVAKVYRAVLDACLDEADVMAFAAGLTLADGTLCMPAELVIAEPFVGIVTVFEGKYHQVKRMFASRGHHVVALHRLSIGSLVLDETMKPGEYRELSSEETERVFQ